MLEKQLRKKEGLGFEGLESWEEKSEVGDRTTGRRSNLIL